MHDIRWIRDNAEAFDAGLARRGLPAQSAELIALDDARKQAVSDLQLLQERRNAASRQIGQAMAAKDPVRADTLKAEIAGLKASIMDGETAQSEADAFLHEALAGIPNLPADDVPDGADEHGNVEYRRHGERPALGFVPKQHFELGEALGLMDFEAAAAMSGARFVVLKGALARLERALGQFFLDTHTGENGYTEVNPPLMVRDAAMFGTAQLPKFEEDQYFGASKKLIKFNPRESVLRREHAIAEYLSKSGLYTDSNRKIFEVLYEKIISDISQEEWIAITQYIERMTDHSDKDAHLISLMQSEIGDIRSNRRWLIPTAEVPLTNLVRESVLAESHLPKRFTALTPCFRAEAGSAGRDTRGMLRQHQFNKVELVSITTPDESGAEHERMLACAETILQKLGLHYRVMTLCAGDMGFASSKTYDIEVWMPGQDTYREISSCSVCGDFQARRMEARYRPTDPARGKTAYVHTLNGSGVAVGRALIAVMENYQQADGSIAIPEALHPYMGGVTRIAAA